MHTLVECQAWHWYLLNRLCVEKRGRVPVTSAVRNLDAQPNRASSQERVLFYRHAALPEVKGQSIDFVCKLWWSRHLLPRWDSTALSGCDRCVTSGGGRQLPLKPPTNVPTEARGCAANEGRCPHTNAVREACSWNGDAQTLCSQTQNRGMREIKYEQLSMKSFGASYCYQQHLFFLMVNLHSFVEQKHKSELYSQIFTLT